MKRVLPLTLAACLALSFTVVWLKQKKSDDSDDFVFRRVKLGMTVGEVWRSEREATDVDGGSLRPTDEKWDSWVVLYFTSKYLYESPLTEIFYLFAYDPAPHPITKGILDSILIKISMPAMGESNPIAAHGKIKEMLTAQYGAPEEDEELNCIWIMSNKRVILWSGPITANGSRVTISIQHPQDSDMSLD